MYTTVIHPIRKALFLSVNEYCVLDMIYRLSHNTKYGGWCVMSRKNISIEIDLSERSVFNIIETLISKGLVEKNELGQLRTLDLWNELIANSHDYYIAFNGKESQFVSGRLPEPYSAKIAEPVQKVPVGGAKSSDEAVQKVHTTIRDNNYINNKSGRFAPPTPLEVEEYCKSRSNGISGQYFCDFYQARGWKLASGTSLKDWRAAVRTWEQRQKKEGGKKTFHQFSEQDLTNTL